jgi:hypothetical protein
MEKANKKEPEVPRSWLLWRAKKNVTSTNDATLEDVCLPEGTIPKEFENYRTPVVMVEAALPGGIPHGRTKAAAYKAHTEEMVKAIGQTIKSVADFADMEDSYASCKDALAEIRLALDVWDSATND